MSILKIRNKPIVRQAIQWTGHNVAEVKEWVGNNIWHNIHSPDVLYVNTLEGQVITRRGDYIIKGIEGEFYPCKAEIFKKTYEVLEDARDE